MQGCSTQSSTQCLPRHVLTLYLSCNSLASFSSLSVLRAVSTSLQPAEVSHELHLDEKTVSSNPGSQVSTGIYLLLQSAMHTPRQCLSWLLHMWLNDQVILGVLARSTGNLMFSTCHEHSLLADVCRRVEFAGRAHDGSKLPVVDSG